MAQMVSIPSPGGPSIRAEAGYRSAPCFQLDLLGGFQLRTPAASVDRPLPAPRVLAVRALNEKPMPRSQVAGTLWPEVSEERARGNLRSVLWRMSGVQALTQGRSLLSLRDDVEVD